MKNLLVFIAFVIPYDLSANLFPGKEPDCWTEPRAVHNDEGVYDEYISKNISIIQNTEIQQHKLDHVSPNKGYSFSTVNDRPQATITINAEKDHLTVIEIRKVFGLSEVKWVNENLLFFRAYWGQEVFVDVLFNVESERIVVSQSGRYSKSVMQQFKQGCKFLGGCDCIKKQESSTQEVN